MHKSSSAALLPLLIEAVNEGVFIVSAKTGEDTFVVEEMNNYLRDLFSFAENPLGLTVDSLLVPRHGRWMQRQLSHVVQSGESTVLNISTDIFTKDKQQVSVRLMPVLEEGKVTRIIGTVQLLSRAIPQQEFSKKDRYLMALEHAPYGVCFVDEKLYPTMLNRELCRWLDQSLSTLSNKPIHEMICEDDRLVFAKALSKVISCGRSYHDIEIQLNTFSNAPAWASVSMSSLCEEDGKTTAIIQFVDITRRKHDEAELLRRATIDHLTNVSNRMVFETSLRTAIAKARRYHRPGAVLYIDLNNFKGVNDTYGHKAGDKVLAEVGHVLKEVFRETDTVSRIGGDEFAVIVEEVSLQEAQWKAALVEKSVNDLHVMAHDKFVKIGVSIGVQAFDGSDDLTADDIIEAADKAMYDHKSHSKSEKPHTAHPRIRIDA